MEDEILKREIGEIAQDLNQKNQVIDQEKVI